MMPLVIRESLPSDLEVITSIYGDAVRTGTGSFETDPPDLAEMTARHATIRNAGYPFLVAEDEGHVIGYAYAKNYHVRSAYRFTVENSVYVASDRRKSGAGSALLSELMARCERAGFRTMIAVIGDSGNSGSILLHKKCGFASAGVLPSVGWKFGRWLDVVFMTRDLGGSTAAAPEEPQPC